MDTLFLRLEAFNRLQNNTSNMETMDMEHTELRCFKYFCEHHLPSDQTKWHYKNVNEFLGELADEINIPSGLQLSEQGTCAFRFNKFVVVVEVPKTGGCLFLYSVVYHADPEDTGLTHAVMKKALELNYLQQATAGTVLSLDRWSEDWLEFTLSYTFPMSGMTCNEFCTIVMNFMTATRGANRTLRRAAAEYRDKLHANDDGDKVTERRRIKVEKKEENEQPGQMPAPKSRSGVRSLNW